MIPKERLELMDVIAEEVTKAARRAGIDWEKLGRLAGVTGGTMSNLVYRHRLVKLATLIDIATAMGLKWEMKLVAGGGKETTVEKSRATKKKGGWKPTVRLGDEE